MAFLYSYVSVSVRCLNDEFTRRYDFCLQVQLCGHATLAASQTLFTYGLVNSLRIEFLTLSGILTARRISKSRASESIELQNGDNAQEDYFIELDFPVVPVTGFNSADISEISKSLNGASVVEILKTTTAEDLVVSFFAI